MTAFGIVRYGSPITQVACPPRALAGDEVRVRVEAACVNHLDERVRSGSFKRLFDLPTPLALGFDFSGVVEEVGRDVTDFAVGDSVFGLLDMQHVGAFAESVTTPARHLARRPDSMTPVQAAAVPMVGLTAWQAFHERAKVQPGSRVLIHGGAGSVGAAAVQVAVAAGAHVIATASARDAEMLREMGVAEVIDYRTEDFESRCADVDVVLDTQGGATLMKSLSVVRPGGLVIGLVGPPDPAFARSMGLKRPLVWAMAVLSARVRAVVRRRGVRYEFLFVQPDGVQLATLARLVEDGKFIPRPGQVQPMSALTAGVPSVLSAAGKGRAVVVPG